MEGLRGLRELFEEGKDISFYNTLVHKVDKVRFRDNVEIFVSGPAAYQSLHLSDLRSYVLIDTFCRFLRFVGYNVHIVMGIDDSKGSYNHSYALEFNDLNITGMTAVSASVVREESMSIIMSLLKNSYAYASGNGIYLDTSKVSSYHNIFLDMSKLQPDDWGREYKDKKHNDSDFALLYAPYVLQDGNLDIDIYRVGAINWSLSNFAISVKYNGGLLDLYCDSEHNMFPRNANSLVISKIYSGDFWCKNYLHIASLAKDASCFYRSNMSSLDDYVQCGYHPLSFRFALLNSHYRKPLLLYSRFLQQASKFDHDYKKLLVRVANVRKEFYTDKKNRQTLLIEYDQEILKFMDKFISALGHDFNTSNALSVLYEVLKAHNMLAAKKMYLIESFDEVLGLNLLNRPL